MKLKAILFILALTASLALPSVAGEWTVLFNGKPTDKLRGYKEKSFPTNGWAIENGALRAIPGRGVDLVTVEKYTDFELEFEWKVSPGGNSGVMYRVAETAGAPYQTGPEYQLLDDDKHPDGKNPKTSSGSLYALIAPDKVAKTKPVGEFNSTRIVFQKGHVSHWLNGAEAVHYHWGSEDVKTLTAKSKFAGWKDFMTQSEGHIDFQHHGQEVWLRNIRVRKL